MSQRVDKACVAVCVYCSILLIYQDFLFLAQPLHLHGQANVGVAAMSNTARNRARVYTAVTSASLLAIAMFAAVAQAADGEVILTRDVQPRIATRPALVPDPNPLTVQMDRSALVNSSVAAGELSDGDFSQVSSGQSVMTRALQLPMHTPGLDGKSAGAAQGMPNIAGGHGGSGGAISGQINKSLQQGLAPLKMLTGDR
ncbi:hypothetical protein [Geopseudomonas guangdongensis]|nr:hypothetical protein [Pseudomonas guangdongensis]